MRVREWIESRQTNQNHKHFPTMLEKVKLKGEEDYKFVKYLKFYS